MPPKKLTPPDIPKLKTRILQGLLREFKKAAHKRGITDKELEMFLKTNIPSQETK